MATATALETLRNPVQRFVRAAGSQARGRSRAFLTGSGPVEVGLRRATSLDPLALYGPIRRDRWLAAGARVAQMREVSTWLLGDWFAAGTRMYGDLANPKIRRAIQHATKYDVHTLANYAAVAVRFESSRRRENLRFGHHEAVAAFCVREQERWLDLAERERLSVRRLREWIRAVKGTGRFNPFTGRTDAEIRDWHAFVLFLIDTCGFHVEDAANHLFWLLNRFSTVAEWLGEEGIKFRALYGWKNPPATTLDSWQRFRALNATRRTAEIVGDLEHRARTAPRLERSNRTDEE